jgi:transcription initiation factor TFIIIB Brf1 subunit/transcription initiation factor TFIIB
MVGDIRDIRECPDCASPNIVHEYEREQVICRDCGLIYEPTVEEAAPAAKKPAKKRKR